MAALTCEQAGADAMRDEIAGRMWVFRFRKLGATPVRYPRRPGMPTKRPLSSS